MTDRPTDTRRWGRAALVAGLLGAVLLVPWAAGQTNPALEFATGDGNPTGNGPVTTTTIRFRNNTDNPTGTTFATYTPVLTATFTFTNQQYNFAGITPNAAIVFGYANAAAPIFPNLNVYGAPIDAYFTSAGSAVGTGIAVATNRAVEIQAITTPLRVANVATNARVHMADLVITFSRPVDDPILHLAGLGGAVSSQLFSVEFDLLASNVPASFVRLSGSGALSVNANQINHGQANPGATGNDAASGSVRIAATGLTSITLRTYIRGNGGGPWSSNTTNPSGDAFQISMSVGEADLSVAKSVDVATPNVGDDVVFTVTAANAGPSDATGVLVDDLLPSGYAFVGAVAPVGTAYDPATGVWSIGSLARGGSRTLTITARVQATGDTTNVAVVTGAQGDPFAGNDSASAAVVPRPAADLRLEKTASLAGPEVGDQVTYTLTVTNLGPGPATGVSVVDVLPAGTTFVSASPACVDLAGTVTCDVAALAVGADAVFTVTVSVDPSPLGTILVNAATVSAVEHDHVATNDTTAVAVVVSGLQLEKSVCNLTTSGCAVPGDFAASVAGVPGDLLEYRVAYLRFGPPVFDVVLADDVPAATLFVVDAYGAGQDVRLLCPDGSTSFVATGPVAALAIDLAVACTLDTATRADGVTVSEALLPGQAGEFRFRVAIP